MKRTLHKRERSIGLLYAIGLLGMLAIIVLICIDRQGQTQLAKEASYQDISSSWTLDKEGKHSHAVYVLRRQEGIAEV